MTEGFLRSFDPALEVFSAGTQPAARINPFAVQAMKEVGIDITAQHSKSLDQVPWQTADTVITLCGESDEVCPAVAATVRRVHWPLPDPAAAPEAERLAVFREVRDEIRWRIAALWSPA